MALRGGDRHLGRLDTGRFTGVSTALASTHVRPARPGEAPRLSQLALRSKAYWGYDAEFLDRCRGELEVRSEQLAALRANAVQFYSRQGARQVGEVPSGSIPGRLLPLLALDLSPASRDG